MKTNFANYGIGIGLRAPHFPIFLNSETRPSTVDWVEVISENFMAGRELQNTGAKRNLLKIRQHLPVALHGTALSLGSSTGLDSHYLKNLKRLVEEVEPMLVSDHLCWTRVGQRQTHDLNPIPYTNELVTHVSNQILKVQDFLKRRIVVENVSTYLTHSTSEMREEEFLAELLKRADCGLLLDLNNVYVSASNHGFNPHRFLEHLPVERVAQLHLAGHSDVDGFLIDTHDQPICEAVWDLYDWYGKKLGHPSAMVERDGNIPEWENLLPEIQRLRSGFVPVSAFWTGKSEVNSHSPTLARYESEQHQWVDSLYGEYRVSGVVSDQKRSARDRFTVYEEAFWIRLTETLETDFPELKAALGEEAFCELVFEVLSEYPSQSYSLNELGLRFLEGLRQVAHPQLSLAEKDWSRGLAFLNRAQVVSARLEKRFEQLAQENPEDFDRICMVLHPSLQVLKEQRMVFWFDSAPKEKSFSLSEWPAIVALTSQAPLSQWEGIPGLNPENIQSWTREGMISGYEKKSE